MSVKKFMKEAYGPNHVYISSAEQNHLPYLVKLVNHLGVPEKCVIWCKNNCQGQWGWFFKDRFQTSSTKGEARPPLFAFEYKEDAIQFKLFYE